MSRNNNNNNNNNTPVTHNDTLHAAVNELVELIAEEEAYYIGKETGRQMRWGELEALGILEDVPAEYQISDVPGTDIFGQSLSKKYNFECECPRCRRTLAAARFAPHLEKCMGMGRNSSRIASRRLAATATSSNISSNGNGSNSSCGSDTVKSIASVQSTNNPSGGGSAAGTPTQQNGGELPSEDEHFEEDEDDEDWTMERKRKNTKKPLEKISPKRKGPLQRVRNADNRSRRGGSPSVTDSPLSITETSLHDDEDFASMTLS